MNHQYGPLTDNPAVGKDLTEFYWRPGNAESFLALVEGLTGEPLTADAWVEDLQKPVDVLVRRNP